MSSSLSFHCPKALPPLSTTQRRIVSLSLLSQQKQYHNSKPDKPSTLGTVPELQKVPTRSVHPSIKYPWEKPEDPSKIKNAYLKYPRATPEDYD